MLRPTLVNVTFFTLTFALLTFVTLTSITQTFASESQASDRFASVEIETLQLTDNVYVLIGSGGNIGVLTGGDGLLMIDDQYAPLSDKIKAALAKLGDDQPAYLINTHYHGDHTGGNINFGHEAIIAAHDNVRTRLINGSEEITQHALPEITYQKQVSIYFNDEEIRLIHLPAGHTDGDTIVHLINNDVIHMGDNFWFPLYPYVDIDAGGSVDGLINNIETTLNMINDSTKVISGHGEVASGKELKIFLNMLKDTRGQVRNAFAAGKTIDEIIETGLSAQWKDWGAGYINEERWIRTLHRQSQDAQHGHH